MKGAWGEGETVRVRPPVALAAGVYFLEARSGTAVARARVVVLP
jgi:hypothetical protein